VVAALARALGVTTDELFGLKLMRSRRPPAMAILAPSGLRRNSTSYSACPRKISAP